MVRVLFLQSSPVWNAIAEVHAELMRGFDPSEVEVHVACTPRPAVHGGPSQLERLSAIPHVHVHPVDFGVSFIDAVDSARRELLATVPKLPRNLLKLGWIIARHRIQVLHFPSKQRDALYGLALARATRCKTVDHMHFKYGDWMARPLKWALHHSDAVVGVSKFASDSIVNEGHVRADRVTYVHNAINPAGWDPTVDGSEVRRELNIPPQAPVIGIVARLIEWKGHAELIEALAGIKAEFPDVQLIAVGGEAAFAQGRSGYKQELVARARELGVEQNVIFLDHRRDVPRLLAALDVFAFPAWEEGFGLALLEAMAMERASVAWNNGGPQELVEHGRTGLLVEPKSVPALREALLTLLRDPALRRSMGKAAREAVLARFSPQVSSQRMAEIYRRVIAGQSVATL